MSTQGVRDFRPRLHFTPPSMWMNDPNGLVYADGLYHLFYQHNPESPFGGPMHWGHATSRDLVSWTHQPIALYPDALGVIFSGSAVLDTHNTSGFGQDGNPPIVAVFTHHGAYEQQSIAYSLDGVSFTKYAGNPVIANDTRHDFRDPKVFWNEQKNCWGLVLAAFDRVLFYASPDLKNWEFVSEFGPEGNHAPGVWECPDFFPLELDGQTHWVLLVSMGMATDEGGARTQYFLGSFDGTCFHCADTFSQAEFLDSGFDNYAGVTFQNAPERVLIGWGVNWQYADKTPTGEFCGLMTLPRRLRLISTARGMRLACEPMGLRLAPARPIANGGALPGEVFVLTAKGTGACTLSLENARGQVLRFGVTEANEVFVDRAQAGANAFSPVFASAPYSRACATRFSDGAWQLQLVLDVCSCELFADEGARSFSQVVYPEVPYSVFRCTGTCDCTVNEVL